MIRLQLLRWSGLFLLLSGWGAVPAVNAQIRTDWTGYLEHQYSVSYTDGSWSHLDYDRARIDIDAVAGRDTRVSVGGIGQIFRGDTRVALRDVLPDDLDALADTLSFAVRDRFFLNHAFVSLRPGPVELTAGKQYLTWGAGYVFNPTELFRPKNVLEPTYEREGVGAISMRLPLGRLSDVLIGFVPEGGITQSGKLIRARHHFGGFDVSALVATLYEVDPRFVSLTDPAANQRRVTFGGDVTGELFGLGSWVEATWSDHAGRRWVEATVGSNYTLADGTLLLLEGYYNGRGEWSDPYPPQGWFGQLLGNSRSLGKAIVFASASRAIDEFQLWRVGLAGIGNVGDASAVLIPSISYAFAENVDLLFNGVVYLGPDGAEFGGRRFGGFVRGRVYF